MSGQREANSPISSFSATFSAAGNGTNWSPTTKDVIPTNLNFENLVRLRFINFMNELCYIELALEKPIYELETAFLKHIHN